MKTSDIQFEEKIEWLIDPQRLPYVRQVLEDTNHPIFPPDKRMPAGQTLVGFAILGSQAPCNQELKYQRRILFLGCHDRHFQPNGVYRRGCPAEAVDALTIEPGQPGRITRRAMGTDVDGSKHSKESHLAYALTAVAHVADDQENSWRIASWLRDLRDAVEGGPEVMDRFLGNLHLNFPELTAYVASIRNQCPGCPDHPSTRSE